jgi:hypothetical protein
MTKMAMFIGFLVISLSGCSTMDNKAHLEHDTCMYMLLDAGQVGNTCEWHTNDIEGTINIAMIKPNMCHVLISKIDNSSQKIEACYENNKWKFYDR